MELKNFLNEFEYDWAAFPAQQKKFPAKELKNKTVLVSGGHHGFARCLVYSLFAANDLQGLSMKIILVGRDSSAITGYFPQLLKRQDFHFFTFEQAVGNESLSADYFILADEQKNVSASFVNSDPVTAATSGWSKRLNFLLVKSIMRKRC